MRHTADFFRDEVRCGFYIPTAIKQAWAVTLDVLAEIDRICEQQGIRYFADWGTLLGAVRHGGFIPWDDDLDICMLRDDYVRFREVADRELPETFVIHDYERQENHRLFLARVVNNARISFDEGFLASHYNFPWLAGVDIFLKDYLYDDPEQEQARDTEVLKILAVADGIADGTMRRETVSEQLHLFRERYGVVIGDSMSDRETFVALYRLAEEQMARVAPSESDTVGQIFPWILKGGNGEPKAWYEKTVRLPFEDTTVPVPACYHKVLTSRYGNYLEIRKGHSAHDYPYFEGQKADFEQSAGVKLPQFTFREEMLVRPEAYIQAPEEGREALRVRRAEKRRAVLFLPTGPGEWAGFTPYYEYETARTDTEVCVVPLPLLVKDMLGQIVTPEEEMMTAAHTEAYPGDVACTDWWDYDVTLHCPDVIYIQNPYDAQNPVLTVPPVFYAEFLSHFTEQLVYVPVARTAEFTKEDAGDRYNLKHYVTAPGVVYADRVIVQSENIREQYIDVLCAFAGEDTRGVWEEKIRAEEQKGAEASRAAQVQTSAEAAHADAAGVKKHLLVCIGINEPAEHGEKLQEALAYRTGLLREAVESGSLAVTFMLYPSDRGAWKSVDPVLSETVHSMPEDAVSDETGSGSAADAVGDADRITMRFDAYYGSASPLVPAFVMRKKPVMIADFGI